MERMKFVVPQLPRVYMCVFITAHFHMNWLNQRSRLDELSSNAEEKDTTYGYYWRRRMPQHVEDNDTDDDDGENREQVVELLKANGEPEGLNGFLVMKSRDRRTYFLVRRVVVNEEGEIEHFVRLDPYGSGTLIYENEEGTTTEQHGVRLDSLCLLQ